MHQSTDDFFPLLRQAIAEARSAGLSALVEDLDARSTAAYTTSSELLGEIGLAIQQFLSVGNSSVPEPIVRKLQICLEQVRHVWPDISSQV